MCVCSDDMESTRKTKKYISNISHTHIQSLAFVPIKTECARGEHSRDMAFFPDLFDFFGSFFVLTSNEQNFGRIRFSPIKQARLPVESRDAVLMHGTHWKTTVCPDPRGR